MKLGHSLGMKAKLLDSWSPSDSKFHLPILLLLIETLHLLFIFYPQFFYFSSQNSHSSPLCCDSFKLYIFELFVSGDFFFISMNSRSIITYDSLCNSGNRVPFSSPSDEERLVASAHVRATRNSPSLLIRLAIKVSRARWYTFLRRVYQYQNGFGSDHGPNPLDSRNWMLMELLALVIQIAATLFTLIMSKVERPVWPMRIWVSGYVVGCSFGILLLCWRCRLIRATLGESSNVSVSDIERQRNQEEQSRSLHYMNKSKASLELLFAIWFVMGNVWVFDTRLSSYNQAPKLHILCIALLSWNAVSYSFPFILFVLLCCFVPMLSTLLGYNMNTASLDRGATDEQIASLQSWKFNDIVSKIENGISAQKSEIPECCICLAKYTDKEEIRQLPCTHTFHLKCVDQWLKIISCCPLCKQGI